MEFFEVTLGDIGILIVIGIAGMMGLALGMVKAVLFVTSWIGAGLITLYTYESVTPLFAKMFGQQLYAEVAGASSIFIIRIYK